MEIVTSWMREGIQIGRQEGRQEGKQEEAVIFNYATAKASFWFADSSVALPDN